MSKESIAAIEAQIAELQSKLREEIAMFQNTCDHDFVRDDDGDYHRPSYYYVCAKCNALSQGRPKKFRSH
jgi:hypothetical protein